VAAQVTGLTQRIAPAFAEVAADPAVVELPSDLPERLVAAVAARAEHCARVVT
jgi:hypothetical protein